MILLLVALQLDAAPAANPPPPIRQWMHTTWELKDGVPSDILGLAQTADGYLWIASLEGAVRFDGVQFTRLTSLFPMDSSLRQAVGSLLGSRDGSLWIVWLNGEVGRFQNGRIRHYGKKDGLPPAFAFTESASGSLLAGTEQGLWQFTGEAWHPVSELWGFPGKPIRALRYDGENVLWVQSGDRILYLPGGASRFLDPGIRLLGSGSPVGFATGSGRGAWIAEGARSVYALRKVGESPPVTELMVGSLSLLIDRRGSLWVATRGDGLRRVVHPASIRGKRIEQFGLEAEHFTTRDGLLSDVVDWILEDQEGNIWLASKRGIERFRESAFVSVPTPGRDQPKVVFALSDTSLWIAESGTNGFIRVRARDTTQIQHPASLEGVVRDRQGRTLVLSTEELFEYRSGALVPAAGSASGTGGYSSLAIDSTGAWWFFDQGRGLVRVEDGRTVLAAAVPGVPDPNGQLRADSRNRLWIIQAHSLFLYERGRLTPLPHDEGEPSRAVLDIFEDRHGEIWSVGRWLGRYEGGRFRRLKNFARPPIATIFGIAESDDGAWWMATRHGVVRLPPGEAARALADSAYVPQYRLFDRHDGLPGVVSGNLIGPTVIRGADGRIWFATDAAVAGINPRQVAPPRQPSVLIEAVRANGRVFLPESAMPLPARSRDIEIDYTAMTLSAPERLRFRYQLEGEDDGWTEVGTRRRAYYGSLAPGRYTFRVATSVGDGLWQEAVAPLAFRVLPAWYQTIIFRGMVAMLVVGLGAAVGVLVQRRRHRRVHEALTAKYEGTLAERARIAQDLHDTLMQGFAGVTLQLKAVELSVPDRPEVTARLGAIQQLARDSLREARERVWEMRDTATTTEDLPAALETIARERTSGHGIEVALHVGGVRRKLAPVCEDAVFRVAREAIVNAVQHSGARWIEIELRYGEKSLVVEVRDDGRGFTLVEGDEARQRGHFGLSGMRDRAAHAGGRCEVRPRPEGGTIVSVELPIE